MLSVNKIDSTQSTHLNQNKKISFKSKLVPNKTLVHLLDAMSSEKAPLYTAKRLANTMESILNDGRDDLVEYTTTKKGDISCKLNGKKIKTSKKDDEAARLDSLENLKRLTNDEIAAIKNALNKLNADLNADDVTKNPYILINLDNNIAEIEKVLRQHTIDLINKLKEKIFTEVK